MTRILFLRGLFVATAALAQATVAGAASASAPPPEARGDWVAYGRTSLGGAHSPLTEISPANVSRLEVAWRYRTGEKGVDTGGLAFLETTPIVADGAMYLNTPLGKVIALDATTGAELWKRDLGEAQPDGRPRGIITRGVSLWRDARLRADEPCAVRIVAGVFARLHALDARTGASCKDFGAGGAVDLARGLRREPTAGESYGVTSPPAVVGDLVIVGSWLDDDLHSRVASGEVRAFDARTGARVWSWDPIPQDPADPAHATWEGKVAHAAGGANTWAVITADAERDLVFLPSSSPSVDLWGGHRLGDNRYANSVVALRASTGKLVWHFQTVHHDLWNYDNPSAPALVTIERDGRAIDVVLVATKTAQLFVLDRETGAPVFPVEERPAPASDVPGERAAPTQPFSVGLPTLGTPRDVNKEAACLGERRYAGPFTPPSLQGSLQIPSPIGGAHWGGTAYDPARGLAIIPTNRLVASVKLVPRAQAPSAVDTGNTLDHPHPMADTPYVALAEPYLCLAPPLGELVAVNLREGRLAWIVPLGAMELPGPTGGRLEGLPNLGGAITTAAGLTFIAATGDAQLRAYDTATGTELWKGQLPAAGATPMTYTGAAGRQYVAVAAGGNIISSGITGDEIVTFALVQER